MTRRDLITTLIPFLLGLALGMVQVVWGVL
jgi:hypothetical protein